MNEAIMNARQTILEAMQAEILRMLESVAENISERVAGEVVDDDDFAMDTEQIQRLIVEKLGELDLESELRSIQPATV